MQELMMRMNVFSSTHEKMHSESQEEYQIGKPTLFSLPISNYIHPMAAVSHTQLLKQICLDFYASIFQHKVLTPRRWS
jgi:hypothetical protein